MAIVRNRKTYNKRSKLRRVKVGLKLRKLTKLCKAEISWVDNILSWTVPIYLKSPNLQVHYRTQGKINEKIARELMIHMPKEIKFISLPCEIIFTRIAPRRLDSDNNTFAFKYIRDYISSHLRPGLRAGRADTEDLFKFDYSQESSDKGTYGIKITIKNLAV
jgi:hypothetical protein